MSESTTGPATDNVSPFPNSRCASEPDGFRDATLDLTAAVKPAAVVPGESSVKDGDADKIVPGAVVDESVIRDPLVLDGCPVTPPRFRPRGEALPPPPVPPERPPPPPDDPPLTRLSMKGDASARDANPGTAHARITRKVRAREAALRVRFAFIMSRVPCFFPVKETAPWHDECNSGARDSGIAKFSSLWNTAGLLVNRAGVVRRRDRLRAQRRGAST
jgi:U5 snRNP spliceosome subunit